MRLLQTRILLEIKKEDAKTKGGLFLPQSVAEKKTKFGTVLEVADDCEYCEVGDIVIFDEYAGTVLTWEVDGAMKDCLVIKEDDVIAYVEKE
jgi:chaperonin GroES